jgi:hypothetical protein
VVPQMTLRRCSFCDHHQDVCKLLFVKDDIGICDRCIEVCNLAIAEPGKRGAQEYDSWQDAFQFQMIVSVS